MEQVGGLAGGRGRKLISRAEAKPVWFFTHGKNLEFYFDLNGKPLKKMYFKTLH